MKRSLCHRRLVCEAAAQFVIWNKTVQMLSERLTFYPFLLSNSGEAALFN